jgi:hypothetical protein
MTVTGTLPHAPGEWRVINWRQVCRSVRRLQIRIAEAMRDRLPQGGFEGLEPYDWKLSCTVLRGACGLVTVLRAGNGPRLPDRLSRGI